MQHKTIVRYAWGLSLSLVAVSAAFAWAVNQRERAYEQVAAEAARLEAERAAATPAGVGDAATGTASAVSVSADAAKAAYEKRCAKCHEPVEMTDYVATLPAGGVEDAMFEFLQKHKKAPEPDNRVLAAYFAGGGTV